MGDGAPQVSRRATRVSTIALGVAAALAKRVAWWTPENAKAAAGTLTLAGWWRSERAVADRPRVGHFFNYPG